MNEGQELPFGVAEGGSPPLTPDDVITREMPDEVAGWWKSLQVSGDFTVEIERANSIGGVESMPPVQNRVPGKAEIGRQYGPGKYRFTLAYKPKNWTKGTDRKSGPWFELSEDGYREMHLEYLDRRDAQRRGKGAEAPSPLSGLREMAPILQTLVGAVKNQSAAPAQDNTLTVALIQGMQQQAQSQMGMMMQFMQSQTQMFMAMMDRQEKQTQALLARQQEQGGADKTFDRIIGMVEKSMELKDRLTGAVKDEPSLIEKLVGAAGELLPRIGDMLGALKATPAPFRGPLIQGALAGQPVEIRQGVSQMQTDSAFREKVIAKAQEVYGPESDTLLEALEIIAPEQAQV